MYSLWRVRTPARDVLPAMWQSDSTDGSNNNDNSD
jgi:hypothetical protein